MLDFINKLNDKDAITDSRNDNPRTSMHITKKTNQYYSKFQKELAKQGINATLGQLAHAAIRIVSVSKDDIAIAKMEQRHNDEQAKLQKRIKSLETQLSDAIAQVGTLKFQLGQIKNGKK